MPFDIRKLAYRIRVSLEMDRPRDLSLLEDDGSYFAWDPERNEFILVPELQEQAIESEIRTGGLCPQCWETLPVGERQALETYLMGFEQGYDPWSKQGNSMRQYLGADYQRVQRGFNRAATRLKRCPHK